MAHAHSSAQSPDDNSTRPSDTTATHGEIISTIEHFHERYTALIESFNSLVSSKQWQLVEAVASSNEPVTLTRLGEMLGCSRQNAKKLAGAAEKKQLVEMSDGPNNSVLVSTTARWNEIAERVAQRRLEVEKKVFSNFSDEELTQFKDFVTRLSAALTPSENSAAGEA